MANGKFEVGQRVEIVRTGLYILESDERTGTIVNLNYAGGGEIEVVVDNYTTEEPFAGGWDTLTFSQSMLKAVQE